jgi:hypothetical protein
MASETIVDQWESEYREKLVKLNKLLQKGIDHGGSTQLEMMSITVAFCHVLHACERKNEAHFLELKERLDCLFPKS